METMAKWKGNHEICSFQANFKSQLRQDMETTWFPPANNVVSTWKQHCFHSWKWCCFHLVVSHHGNDVETKKVIISRLISSQNPGKWWKSHGFHMEVTSFPPVKMTWKQHCFHLVVSHHGKDIISAHGSNVKTTKVINSKPILSYIPSIPWKPPGFHVNTTWFPCGYHVVSMWKPQFPCGHHMVTMWTSHGFQVDTMWLSHGHHMVSGWKPCGFHLDTMWFLHGVHGFCMDTWFPPGHHFVSRKPHGNQLCMKPIGFLAYILLWLFCQRS